MPEVLERGPEGVGCLRDVMAVFPLLGSLWGLWALNGTSEMALSSHSGKRQGKALIWFCSFLCVWHMCNGNGSLCPGQQQGQAPSWPCSFSTMIIALSDLAGAVQSREGQRRAWYGLRIMSHILLKQSFSVKTPRKQENQSRI